MTIPARLQIFDTPVVLTDKDAARLSPFLAYWDKLHLFLSLGVNEHDLRRLVIIELMDRQRKQILDRLLMRLGRVQRRRIELKISNLLGPCSNVK